MRLFSFYKYYNKKFFKNQICECIIYIVNAFALTGGDDRLCSRYLLSANQVLFSLSYIPIFSKVVDLSALTVLMGSQEKLLTL